MPAPTYPLAPHHSQQSTSIRKIYIQNLTDLLHVCLLRGDTVRARRAWAILIRCREVDWRSRWYWGLQCLNAASAEDDQLVSTFQSEQYAGRQAERWLRSVRISAREADKPSLLHALVLHLIKHDRHRAALDELDTYLTSYPYLLSGPLHTYAGLLAFYLAQPASLRTVAPSESQANPSRGTSMPSSPTTSSTRSSPVPRLNATQPPSEPANAAMLKQARAYFNKALSLDLNDDVAVQFIDLIDRPDGPDPFESDAERSRRTDSHSIRGASRDTASRDEYHMGDSSEDSEGEHKEDDKEDTGSSDGETTTTATMSSDGASRLNLTQLLEGYIDVSDEE